MPVREIGGISRANLAGVASLSRKDGGLMVGFNPNHPVRPGVRVHSEGRAASVSPDD